MSELLQDMKTRRFWGKFLTKTFALLGTVTAVVKGVVTLWPKHADWFGGGTIFVIALVLCALIGLGLTWPRPIECDYSSPRTKIKIVKGNLFEEKNDLVVGITNSFDTEIPQIIERKSLLGQAIDQLYGGNWKRLDTELMIALTGKAPVDNINKPGKQDLYELGSVATVSSGSRRVFFSAYSQMNANNNASTTIETLTKSLHLLWDEVIAKGNGQPVAITPWGSGLSRISGVLPAQDSIRLIILTFMFASRKQKVSDELTVVVPESIFKNLDRLELQAFLSSLRSS
ncbi:hypothetical protein FHY13_003748 [Xanthomonas arboricola]|uniref:macro domain-containing protein n=1 Tax=Xanthomonas euroxanthea TaxID=2259622 RepID=UPI001611134B|nr:macro domain-containing protein [Xanthomonas euroxanthea]MBB3815356.1 hypothetical protein [Xanthomonas euroxanthea]